MFKTVDKTIDLNIFEANTDDELGLANRKLKEMPDYTPDTMLFDFRVIHGKTGKSTLFLRYGIQA